MTVNDSIQVILGAQWGDEGKGKLVDILSQDVQLCCRFNAGSNAGHTLVIDSHKFALNLLPSGIINKGCMNLIGNGVVLHIPTFLKEIKELEVYDSTVRNRIRVSTLATILTDAHRIVDGILEGRAENSIGTTKKGIGPCYSMKHTSLVLKVSDLVSDFHSFELKYRNSICLLMRLYKFDFDVEADLQNYKKYGEELKLLIVDSVHLVNLFLAEGKRILIEGANASLLDIDHGSYPYVTSSTVVCGGVLTGLGIGFRSLRSASILGVVKAYTTRVGNGPFPTEIIGPIGVFLREKGGEYGTTTGRPRRCGWLDIPILSYSNHINRFDFLNLTKVDVLTGLHPLKICTHYVYKENDGIKGNEKIRVPLGLLPVNLEVVECVYEELDGWYEDIGNCNEWDELPKNARIYVERVEELCGIRIKWVGVGSDRKSIIRRF